MQTQLLCKVTHCVGHVLANIIASLAYCYLMHKTQSGDWPAHVISILAKQLLPLHCCAQYCHIKTVNQDLEYYMPLF